MCNPKLHGDAIKALQAYTSLIMSDHKRYAVRYTKYRATIETLSGSVQTAVKSLTDDLKATQAVAKNMDQLVKMIDPLLEAGDKGKIANAKKIADDFLAKANKYMNDCNAIGEGIGQSLKNSGIANEDLMTIKKVKLIGNISSFIEAEIFKLEAKHKKIVAELEKSANS